MKQLTLTIIIAFACVTALFAQPETTNQKDTKGLKTGFWQEQLPEGNFSGFYREGLKESTWTLRSIPNNALIRVESFINGKHSGIYLDFNQQGQVTGEKYFVNELLEGTAKTFFWGVQISTSTSYKNGVLHGKKLVYYENTNGKLQEESNFKNGLKDGDSRWFSNTGDTVAVYKYQNGKLSGIQKTFYPGNKIQSMQNYVNNIESGSYKEYFENGKVKIESAYANGKQEGKYTEYDDSGAKTTEGTFIAGLEEGKWLYYDKTGKITKTKKFTKGAEQK